MLLFLEFDIFIWERRTQLMLSSKIKPNIISNTYQFRIISFRQHFSTLPSYLLFYWNRSYRSNCVYIFCLFALNQNHFDLYKISIQQYLYTICYGLCTKHTLFTHILLLSSIRLDSVSIFFLWINCWTLRSLDLTLYIFIKFFSL